MRYTFIALLLTLLFLTACNANPPSAVGYDAIPTEGDISNGQILYINGKDSAPPCIACHIVGATGSPDLTGFTNRAGETVAGESAHEYAFYSITEPGRYIVEGYGNAMFNRYDEIFTEQEIADLIAYILSL